MVSLLWVGLKSQKAGLLRRAGFAGRFIRACKSTVPSWAGKEEAEEIIAADVHNNGIIGPASGEVKRSAASGL